MVLAGYWWNIGMDSGVVLARPPMITGLVLESSTGPVLSVGAGMVLARPLIITQLGVGSQY